MSMELDSSNYKMMQAKTYKDHSPINTTIFILCHLLV